MSSSDLKRVLHFLSEREAWEKRCKQAEEHSLLIHRQLSGALASPLSARGQKKSSAESNDVVGSILVSVAQDDLSYISAAVRDPQKLTTLMSFRSSEGDTILHVFVRENHNAATKILLQHLSFNGSKNTLQNFINAQNNWQDTALHLSLSDSDSEIALLLMSVGADPYLKNQNSDTSLYLACGIGWLDAVWKMIQHPNTTAATISVCSPDGLSPAQIAEQSGHKQIAQLLKETKAKLSA